MKSQHNRVPVAYAIKNINAIELLGGFRNAALESGWTAAQVQEITKEAMVGDYEHLHRVLAKYCVAPSGLPSRKKKWNKIIKKAITFTLSLNSAGVAECHLYQGGEHLLSAAHPTTIAAAIFAMGECKVVFLADTEYVQFPFPVSVADFLALQRFINTYEESYFIAQFAKSSWFDFLNPHPADNKAQAEFHLVAAVSHLPRRLVKNGPSTSLPKGLTEKLRSGNRVSPFAPD